MASPVLNEVESRFLEVEKLIHPHPSPGKRKVSSAFLSPPPSSSFGSSTSPSSSASVRFKSWSSSDSSTIDIPVTSSSAEAVEFLGFTLQSADTIFSDWSKRPDPDQCPDSPLDYALGHLGILKTPSFSALDPREAMTKIGLSIELQDIMMNPEYSDILYTRDLHFWLADTLTLRFSALENILLRMKETATHGLARGKAKRPKLEGVFTSQTEEPDVVPAHTATVNMFPGDDNLPKTSVSIEAAPSLLVDHYTLWKGKSSAETNNRQLIKEDGSVNINALRSFSGDDFNGQDYAWYFTKEQETAERYRNWAALRCQYAASWLIQVQVPRVWFDTLKKQYLFYSADWKEYVWRCKKEEDIPDKFNSMLEADVIEGHICTGVSTSIAGYKSHEVQTKINDSHCLRLAGGRRATQTVIMKLEAAKRLGVEIKGKMHIDITAAIQAQDVK
jgi:hypothetical protein